MRSNILDQNRSASLRVFMVWLPMLPGDGRQTIDGKVLADPRVTVYWDSDRTLGSWYSANVSGGEGPTWDTWFLYGRTSRWTRAPTAQVASGSPVAGSTDDLLAGFRAATR